MALYMGVRELEGLASEFEKSMVHTDVLLVVYSAFARRYGSL